MLVKNINEIILRKVAKTEKKQKNVRKAEEVAAMLVT